MRRWLCRRLGHDGRVIDGSVARAADGRWSHWRRCRRCGHEWREEMGA